MDNKAFIEDRACEYGLDVDVSSMIDDELCKRIFDVSTRVDGERYTFEIVTDIDRDIHDTDLLIRQLDDSLQTMCDAITNDLPESIE